MANYHIVKDLTNDVIQVANNIKRFPKDVKIIRAGLAVDDWGTYFVDIDYEIDSIEFNITRRVFNDLSGAINTALGDIFEFYIKIHEPNLNDLNQLS